MNDRFTIRCAVYLILRQDGKLLLSRRANTGWMDGYYSFIAGHLEKDENIFETMIREAEEETGIVINDFDLIPVHTLHRRSEDEVEYIDFFFTANFWTGNPEIKEPDKCDILNWFSEDNLPINLLPYLHHVLYMTSLGVPFSIYGWD